MRIVALDLSLTATGIAIHDPELSGRPPTHTSLLTVKTGKMRGMSRLSYIRTEVRTAMVWRGDKPSLVMIEGYSFGSKGRAVVSIGELGGIIRHLCYSLPVPYVEMPPAKVKMLATGKGNATKDAVLLATLKRLGVEPKDNNQADALWLLEAARQRYELPGRADLPKIHLRALRGVQWPNV